MFVPLVRWKFIAASGNARGAMDGWSRIDKNNRTHRLRESRSRRRRGQTECGRGGSAHEKEGEFHESSSNRPDG